ncbi:Flagellar biosynthetic protein FlhB [uncultured bacterium]|nr:Flagellar biosynthetic protein FlhB [uncultured bacterium]
MALADQEKTEAPTQRRRDDARDEGRIPRSQELTTSFVLLGGALLLNAAGPVLGARLLALFRDGLVAMGSAPLTSDAAVSLMRDQGWKTLAVLGTWGVALMGLAVAVAGPQGRGVISAKPITPDASRLSPGQNLKRILGGQALVELVKSLVKLLLVALVVRVTLGGAWDDFLALTDLSPEGFLLVVKRHVVRLLMTAGLAYLAIAAFDYLWQVWRFEQSLKMSRDEVRQEMKQTEGDPLVKQRIRSFGRALARRQMMRDIPTADVVITNPTHLAVALRYDPLKAPAPIVVAMGQRKVAERIKALAKEHGVPCIENRPLARALVASARVGSMIPSELYVAVAEVLAFLFRRRVARERRLTGVTA